MAGYIFSVRQDLIDEVFACNVYNGFFAPYTPEITQEILEEGSVRKIKSINKVLASVFADFVSMKEGDNVYFLSKRKIYGVGKLKNIGADCKYDNFPDASKLIPNCNVDTTNASNFLTTSTTQARWVLFFEPETHFFAKGVDMDDVLQYKPSAFKMLRAFEKLSFIKIDDEENRALKEYIYIVNEREDTPEELPFDDTFQNSLSSIDLVPYTLDITKAIDVNNHFNLIFSEMFIEASLVQFLSRRQCDAFGSWDNITHQLIASPFKPLKHIDKIDIFGYRFSEMYTDKPALISKYVVVELKKETINKAALEQTMQYVDWICSEYTSGDYSRIEAYVVGNSTVNNIDHLREEYCERSYISETHPVVTKRWNNLSIVLYDIDIDEHTISFSTIDD